MLLRLVGCVMLVAVAAEVAVTAHEVTADSKKPGWSAFSARVMPIDEAIDLRFANSDPDHVDEHLLQATTKNPYNTPIWIRLSVDAEARGDDAAAALYLKEAATHDAGTAPRWANANFYFRKGDRAQFFMWANSYRARTHENEAGLFRMVAEVTPDAHSMLAELPAMRCDELSSLLTTLNTREQDSDEVVRTMASGCHDIDSHHALSQLVSDLLAKDKPTVADHVWREMGEPGNIANAEFEHPISGEGFDWRINQNPDIQVMQPQKQGVRFNFSDRVPSGTVLLFQPVSLNPGAGYRLVMNFDSDPPSTDAFRWELVELSTGHHIASGLDTENINLQPVWRFDMPNTGKTLALALFYIRPEGTTPFQGTVNIHAVQLARQIQPDLAAPKNRSTHRNGS